MASNLASSFRSIEDPSWAPFSLLQHEMGRLFEDVSRNGAMKTVPGGVIAPRLDVKETDKWFRVPVELPGVAEQDIEVEVDDDLLTVRAEKKEGPEIERADQHIAERRLGVFQRSIRLPQTVDAQTVKATVENALLQIVIPRSKRQTSKRRVPIANANAAAAGERASAGGQAA